MIDSTVVLKYSLMFTACKRYFFISNFFLFFVSSFFSALLEGNTKIDVTAIFLVGSNN